MNRHPSGGAVATRLLSSCFAVIVIGFVVGLAPSAVLQAATPVFVNPDGVCAGNVPCFTAIQAGVNSVNVGGTVNVAAGTYNEQVTITKALTMTGADGAILDGTGLVPVWTTGVKIRSGNVTFDNIDVTNFTQDGITAYDNIDMPNLHITNCRISNIQPGYWGFGIYVGYESEGFGYAPPDLTSHLDFSGLLIEGNEITNVHSSALVLQSITGTPGTLKIRNNNIHDNTTNSGIWIDCARNLLIENNTVVRNKWGVEFSAYAETSHTLNGPYGPKDITLRGNIISNNTNQGIAIYEGWPDTFVMGGNTIEGNGSGIDNQVAGLLNATNQWWGCNAGPGNPGCASAGANVDFDPWLVLRLDVAPDTITPGGTSTLTADMTFNSDGADASASGFIPDGLDVLFTTSLGSVGSPSVIKQLANGKATATLVADAGVGVADVSATVDSQTVTASVTIEPVRAIPTMNEWGMMMLLLLLGAVALAQLGRILPL